MPPHPEQEPARSQTNVAEDPAAQSPRPKISVLLAAYNSAETVAAAIRSVLEQTEQSYELLVIDDGSSDKTAEVADEFARQDARVRVIRMAQNGGQSKALNHGIALARGRWTATLDADDRYHPKRLAALIEAGDRQGVDLVAENLFLVDGATGSVVGSAFDPAEGPRRLTVNDLVPDIFAAKFDIVITKPAFRTDFLRQHGLRYYENTKFAQDFLILVDFFAAGGRAWLLPEPFYYYTLPVSPSLGSWTNTGLGAWRYNYSYVCGIIRDYLDKPLVRRDRALTRMLRRRNRHYDLLEHYQHAVHAFKVERRAGKAIEILLANPGAALAFGYRVWRRCGRALSRRPESMTLTVGK